MSFSREEMRSTSSSKSCWTSNRSLPTGAERILRRSGRRVAGPPRGLRGRPPLAHPTFQVTLPTGCRTFFVEKRNNDSTNVSSPQVHKYWLVTNQEWLGLDIVLNTEEWSKLNRNGFVLPTCDVPFSYLCTSQLSCKLHLRIAFLFMTRKFIRTRKPKSLVLV